ncbi:MAG: thiamine phosphate synthase [Nocardioides sp.]
MTRPRLLVLTDRHQLPPGRSLERTVRDCAAAGLTSVVLRELDLAEPERAELAAELARLVTVISARTLLPAAAGVHLAAHQPGPGTRHGRSCHDEAQLRQAVAGGASWVTLSPVALSPSKPGYGPALGVDGVRRLLPAAAGVPVYGLGGIDETFAAAVVAAGAHGVAVMGGVMRADDPAAEVERLLEAVG